MPSSRPRVKVTPVPPRSPGRASDSATGSARSVERSCVARGDCPGAARPDAYPTRRGAAAVMLKADAALVERRRSRSSHASAACQPRPRRSRAAAISDRPWCRGRALPARRCRRCYAGGAGQDVGASGSASAAARSAARRGTAAAPAPRPVRPKAISAIRLRISRGVRGARSASSGLICTRTTSRAGQVSTSAISGGLALNPPSQYGVPSISTAWCNCGRQAEARTTSTFSSGLRKIARPVVTSVAAMNRALQSQRRRAKSTSRSSTGRWVHPQRVELVGRQELGGEVRGQLAQTAGAQRAIWARALIFATTRRAPARRRRYRRAAIPTASTTAFSAPPEAPLMPSIRRSASSRRTSTPQVKAPWAPPPEGRD